MVILPPPSINACATFVVARFAAMITRMHPSPATRWVPLMSRVPRILTQWARTAAPTTLPSSFCWQAKYLRSVLRRPSLWKPDYYVQILPSGMTELCRPCCLLFLLLLLFPSLLLLPLVPPATFDSLRGDLISSTPTATSPREWAGLGLSRRDSEQKASKSSALDRVAHHGPSDVQGPSTNGIIKSLTQTAALPDPHMSRYRLHKYILLAPLDQETH
jgi:hypothetical protein